MPKRGADVSAPEIEETTDPLLQKAIMDSLGHEVKFKLPVSGSAPVTAAKAFVSMRQVLAAPQLAAAGPAVSAPIMRPAVGPVPANLGQVGHEAASGQRLGFGIWIEALARQLARGIVGFKGLPKAWVAGFAAFGVFLAVNGAIYVGFSSRVYPGVRVGGVSLAGVTFAQLHSKLAGLAKPASLTVRVGSESYAITTQSSADSDRLASVEAQAKEAGHSTPLPLAGLLETLVSKPLALQPGISSSVAKAQAQQIANQVDYVPTPAAVMVVAGKVLLIADKPGQSLDQARAAEAIQAAYGRASSVSLQVQRLQPLITAGDFAGEVEKAQGALSQAVRVHVKSAVYQPSGAQIGDWLVIAGPGKGVAVNGAAVANYVAGLPGRFDRAGAVNAISAAIVRGQSLDYIASTSKVTSVPKPESSAVSWPLATFNYCLSGNLSNGDAEKVEAVLADKAGWALGGRVSMLKAENGCNFSINIMSTAAMLSLDPGCKGHTTCLSGSAIAIDDSAWKAAPAKWKGTLDAYRTELINHEVGHWLGFQHTPCMAPNASVATPILAAPDLVLSGCSPNWYAIPADQQRTKILPGFN